VEAGEASLPGGRGRPRQSASSRGARRSRSVSSTSVASIACSPGESPPGASSRYPVITAGGDCS